MAVMVVAPAQVLGRHLFSTVAIVWALCLYAAGALSAQQIRRKISPWQVMGASEAGRWKTLRRWVKAACAGQLFEALGPVSGKGQTGARQVVSKLAGCCPPSGSRRSEAEQAVEGALHLMMGITP